MGCNTCLIIQSWVTREIKNPNANRGRYHRKQVSVPIPKPTTPIRANSVINATTRSREITLHSLQVHLQEVTDHVATCEACTDETLKNK